MFLENNCDTNILFIQEPFKGYIKIIASSDNSEGKSYYYTVTHQNFLYLEYSINTRELIYIHKSCNRLAPHAHR